MNNNKYESTACVLKVLEFNSCFFFYSCELCEFERIPMKNALSKMERVQNRKITNKIETVHANISLLKLKLMQIDWIGFGFGQFVIFFMPNKVYLLHDLQMVTTL